MNDGRDAVTSSSPTPTQTIRIRRKYTACMCRSIDQRVALFSRKLNVDTSVSHTSGFKLFGTFDLDPNRNNVKRVGSGQVNASINSLPPGTVAHLESRGQNGTLNKT